MLSHYLVLLLFPLDCNVSFNTYRKISMGKQWMVYFMLPEFSILEIVIVFLQFGSLFCKDLLEGYQVKSINVLDRVLLCFLRKVHIW